MCSCGDIGKEMADEVLIRVPLELARQSSSERDADATDENDATPRVHALEGVLKDVSTSCYEHQRDGARRAVCRVSEMCKCCDVECVMTPG